MREENYDSGQCSSIVTERIKKPLPVVVQDKSNYFNGTLTDFKPARGGFYQRSHSSVERAP